MRHVASPRRIFVSTIIIGAIAILVGYGLFEARRILEGPQISIKFPLNGSATSSSAVIVSGTAENISFLTINDAPAYTDESGHFSVMISPPTGYTVFTVRGVDRFGRRASQQVAFTVVNYCPITS